ncbi:30S ribosomal protein S2 [Bdellovibrionota bacterium]
MPSISMRELLNAGVHFGHQTKRWNPKMKPYIFGERNGIYIIDLQKTVDQTKRACEFLLDVTGKGKKVLFVGTKKQAQETVAEAAQKAGHFYVTNRWLGGTLTNFKTIKMSIQRLQKFEAILEKGEEEGRSKRELLQIERERQKLENSLGGIKNMKRPPGAIFVIDPMKERIAVHEAKLLHIPVIAVVDTNCDPDEIDFVIPGNDDALRSIKLFSDLVAETCLEGAKIFEEFTRKESEKPKPRPKDGDLVKRVTRTSAIEVEATAEPEKKKDADYESDIFGEEVKKPTPLTEKKKAEAQPKVEAKPKTQPKPTPKLKAKPKAEAKPKTKSKPKPKVESKKKPATSKAKSTKKE